MIGIFIGENGSMGFHYNRMYEITLEKTNWIWLKTKEGLYCPYENMEALQKNWKIIG